MSLKTNLKKICDRNIGNISNITKYAKQMAFQNLLFKAVLKRNA